MDRSTSRVSREVAEATFSYAQILKGGDIVNKEELAREIIYFSIFFNFIEWTVDEKYIFINIKNTLSDVIEVENYCTVFPRYAKKKRFKYILDNGRFKRFIYELDKIRDKLE